MLQCGAWISGFALRMLACVVSHQVHQKSHATHCSIFKTLIAGPETALTILWLVKYVCVVVLNIAILLFVHIFLPLHSA